MNITVSGGGYSTPRGKDGHIIIRVKDEQGNLVHQITLGPGAYTLETEIKGGDSS